MFIVNQHLHCNILKKAAAFFIVSAVLINIVIAFNINNNVKLAHNVSKDVFCAVAFVSETINAIGVSFSKSIQNHSSQKSEKNKELDEQISKQKGIIFTQIRADFKAANSYFAAQGALCPNLLKNSFLQDYFCGLYGIIVFSFFMMILPFLFSKGSFYAFNAEIIKNNIFA